MSFLGPLLLAGLFVVAGGGVLHAIRPFRGSLLELLAAVGLAYLMGVTVVIVIGIGLLTAGVAPTLPVLAIVGAAVGAIGAAVGFSRRSDEPATPQMDHLDRAVLLVLAGVFGIFALVSVTGYTSAPLWNWDAWSIWTSKAVALYWFDTLDPRFFAAPAYAFNHQDYPLLLPMLEATHFRAVGRPDTQSVHVQLWFMLVAFPWAVGYLVRPAGRAALWAPIMFGAVMAPGVVTVIIGGLADVPLAIWLTCAVLALGMWVDQGRRSDLVVATVLLAGAASLKNEGVLAAFAALAAAAIVVMAERPRVRLREIGAAAGGVVIAILPWQIWAASHHVPKDVNLSDALSPGYMIGHADRIAPAIQELLRQLGNQDRWSYFVPLAAVAIIVAFRVRVARSVALFYLLAGSFFFGALVWAYWASPHPLVTYLQQSGFRVIGGVAAISMAALVHIAPRLGALGPLARRREEVDDRTLVPHDEREHARAPDALLAGKSD